MAGEKLTSTQEKLREKMDGQSLTVLARKRAERKHRVDALNTEVKLLKDEIDVCDLLLEDAFVAENSSQIRVQFTTSEETLVAFTLFPQKRIVAKLPMGKAGAIQALKDSKKYAAIVKEQYSTQTLNALMKELDEEGRPLPPTFAGRIEALELWSIGQRAAEVKPTRNKQ